MGRRRLNLLNRFHSHILYTYKTKTIPPIKTTTYPLIPYIQKNNVYRYNLLHFTSRPTAMFPITHKNLHMDLTNIRSLVHNIDYSSPLSLKWFS